MTCSMTCGDVNVWPHPTKRTRVMSSSFKFSVESMQLQISTPFQDVEKLFRKSFHVFVRELKQIQKLEYFEHGKVADKFPDDNVNNNHNNINDRSSNMCKKHHCDISNFIVDVHILKSGNIYIDLDTDESYNISSTCEYTFNLFFII